MAKKSSNNSILWKHLAYTAMQVLRKNGGKMWLSELREEVEKQEGQNLKPEHREKDRWGCVVWDYNMQFYAQNYVRAGCLKKLGRGLWQLTPVGMKVLELDDENKVLERVKELIKQPSHQESATEQEPDPESEDIVGRAAIEKYRAKTLAGIEEYIRDMGDYAFQDLCAALLRGMGYPETDVATKRGPDGGIDIVAYTDPLGCKQPRIKAQVKHHGKDNKISEPEVKKLAADLREGDVGVFMTSSSFTAPCKRLARDNAKHIELVNLDRFIQLWITHYDSMAEEDKQLMPLEPIYFLAKE